MKFKVGDKVTYANQGRKVWTIEIVEAPGVYYIARKNEFCSAISGKMLKKYKPPNRRRRSRDREAPRLWEVKESYDRLIRIKFGEDHDKVYQHDEEMSSGDRWHMDNRVIARHYLNYVIPQAKDMI